MQYACAEWLAMAKACQPTCRHNSSIERRSDWQLSAAMSSVRKGQARQLWLAVGLSLQLATALVAFCAADAACMTV